MDIDQLGAFHTLARGLTLDENAFALEAFREIGPGKHYLGSNHTLANYQTAFHHFELADNNSYEQWSVEGSRDQLARANTRWKRLLDEYQPPTLDPAVDEELRDYIDLRKSEMPDDIA
jgi:trimethylamine---corrinoid protein Co-methyltransferase